MYLYEVAEESFVLLRAEWIVAKVRQIIEQLTCTHVIIQHHDFAGVLYYLYLKEELLESLAYSADQSSIAEALDLTHSPSTPTLDLYVDAETAPDRTVIVDAEQVVGFFDAGAPIHEIPMTGGQKADEGTNKDLLSRTLIADFATEVVIEEIVSLLLSISAASDRNPGLSLAAPRGTTIDVIIQPKQGFVLIGASEGSLQITDEEETLSLQFKLMATELGAGRVRILAFQTGQPLGALTVVATIVPRSTSVNPQRRIDERPLPHITVSQPDLSLLILEQGTHSHPTYTMRLVAADPALGLNFKPFGPIHLRSAPWQFFNDCFQDMEELTNPSLHTHTMADFHLAALGANLFEMLVPPDLQVLLWSLRHRIQTIQIQSEEPWIPWELCKLQGMEDGRITDGPFFCEAFAITRWLLDIPQQPRLKLSKIALIAPADAGLSGVQAERDYLLSLAGAARQVEQIPATVESVTQALASGIYDGVHFTGHGHFHTTSPDRSVIQLADRMTFTPQYLSGHIKNLRQGHPFVFLNACQGGRNAMSLTGIGGWAARFLNAGAASFIGAYWSVYDQTAYHFAQALYGYLLSGMTISEASRQARAKIKQPGDPTWLAYTVFANPLATVEQKEKES